jgi:hypothetical protein
MMSRKFTRFGYLLLLALISCTVSWARVFQPSSHKLLSLKTPPQQAQQHPDDELEMEHIEDIENAFHSSKPLPLDRMKGRSSRPLLWRVSTQPPQSPLPTTTTQTASDMNVQEDANSLNYEDSNKNKNLQVGKLSSLLSFGFKKPASTHQANSQSAPTSSAQSSSSSSSSSSSPSPQFSTPSTPSSTRVVSQNSIVIDPTVITAAAVTISKGFGERGCCTL